jgi:hypothetical protein
LLLSRPSILLHFPHPPQPLRQQPAEPVPLHSPHDHRVGRALRHAAPVGGGRAGGVFALLLDLHVVVAGVEEGGLEEVGDRAGVVQGGIFAAGIGGVEAFEDIGPGGDGLADWGGPERCISFPQARGVGALWGTSGGITVRGRPERKTICAASGSSDMLNPASGVMLPPLKQSPPVRTIPATRATMSGARWKAVAMVVRGRGAEGDGDHPGGPQGAGPVAARAGRPDRRDG